MIPISMTSQGDDEIARGQGSADPLGRESLDRDRTALPNSTIRKRSARLKPDFNSNVLSKPSSRCRMLIFRATRCGFACRNNESNRAFISGRVFRLGLGDWSAALAGR
jgi:hypothetical protein